MGQILDEEQGVYYYGARYYLPEIGRFLSGDPAMQFPSPYAYVGNRPVMMVDLDGKIGTIFKYNNNIYMQSKMIYIDADGKMLPPSFAKQANLYLSKIFEGKRGKYDVKTDFEKGENTYVVVRNNRGTSESFSDRGSSTIQLYTGENQDYSIEQRMEVLGHEVNHQFGGKDRYKNGPIVNGRRTAIIETGYESELMGGALNHVGKNGITLENIVTEKTIDNLVNESRERGRLVDTAAPKGFFSKLWDKIWN